MICLSPNCFSSSQSTSPLPSCRTWFSISILSGDCGLILKQVQDEMTLKCHFRPFGSTLYPFVFY